MNKYIVSSCRAVASALLVSLVAFFSLGVAMATETYHVTETGSDTADGKTWATAVATVGIAISKASSGDEIWIASGNFKNGSAMKMKSGVGIYGGFAGTETSKSERVSSNETVLDGDNAYRLFENNFSTEVPLVDAVLDSVTLANGRVPNGSPRGDDGGAMHNYATTILFSNCIFRNNKTTKTGSMGGAIYNGQGSSTTFTDCKFIENEANYGGAIESSYVDKLIVRDCLFEKNRAPQIENYWGGAGAVRIDGGGNTLEFTNCLFRENEASHSGGAIQASTYGDVVTITDCIFYENKLTAEWGNDGGGAIYSYSAQFEISNTTFTRNDAGAGNAGVYRGYTTGYPSNANFKKCKFAGNTAGSGAAVIYSPTSSHIIVSDSLFLENVGTEVGAISTSDSGTALIENSTFHRNSTTVGYAGAIMAGGILTQIVNCTITENTAEGEWAAAVHDGWGNGTRLSIVNSIIWGNKGGGEDGYRQIFYRGSITMVAYSVVQGGIEGSGDNPRLMELGSYSSDTLVQPVGFGSSALAAAGSQSEIDAIYGTGAITIPLTDARGVARNTTSAGTIGAVEFFDAPAAFVQFHASNGEGWMNEQFFTPGTSKGLTHNAFTRTGYTFAGWATTAGSSGVVYLDGDSAHLANRDILPLYAVWTATPFTLSFDGNGNTGGTAPADIVRKMDEIVSLPNGGMLTRPEFAVSSWNTESDGTGTSYALGAQYTFTAEDVKLYAQWTTTKTTTITFVGNGSTGGKAPTTITGTVGSTTTIPNEGTLVKKDYNFGFWASTANEGWPWFWPGDTYTFTDTNITLYAQWFSHSHDYVFVMFDGNGYTSGWPPYSMEGQPGKTIHLPWAGDMEREGYAFIGWNTKADGSGTNYQPESAYKLTKAMDTWLYAMWGQPAIVGGVGQAYENEVENTTTIADSDAKYSAKKLPTGVKLVVGPDGVARLVGTPTKAGKYVVAVTVTSKANSKVKETINVAIEVEGIAPEAVGTFTGVLLDTGGEMVGTWTATTSNVGKTSAKVVTTDKVTGKALTYSFKGICFDYPDPLAPNIYQVIMAVPDKKAQVVRFLTITIDTAKGWDAANTTGEFEITDWANNTLIKTTLLGQRNAFIEKNNLAAQAFLSSILGDWNAQGDSSKWEEAVRGKRSSALDKFVNIKIAKGGKITYSGKLADGTKFSGSTTLLHDTVTYGATLCPIFSAIKNSTTPEAAIIKIDNSIK